MAPRLVFFVCSTLGFKRGARGRMAPRLVFFVCSTLIPIIAQDMSWILWKSELARESSKPLRQTLTTFAAQGERNGADNLSNHSYELRSTV